MTTFAKLSVTSQNEVSALVKKTFGDYTVIYENETFGRENGMQYGYLHFTKDAYGKIVCNLVNGTNDGPDTIDATCYVSE